MVPGFLSRPRFRKLLAVLLPAAVCFSVGQCEDWLRFRGPNGSGVCLDKAPVPAEWGPTKNLKWKVAVPGAGVSCPVVVGSRVFVTCYDGYGLDRREPGEQEDLTRSMVCFDRADGTVLWQKTVKAVLPEDPYSGMGVPEHGYASHTPVSDGKHIYAFFGKSGVFAWDLDGRELWHAPVGLESDPRRWGSSSSPVLSGNILIVPAGPESRAVIGFDAGTGKEIWRAESEGLGNVWGTPIEVTSDGRTDVVIGAPNEIWGLNPETGKLRWFCEAMETDQFSSSVVEADGMIYAIEGRGGGSIAVKAGGKGDVTKTHVIWSGRDSSRFGTPVVYDGRIYYFSNKVVNCMNAVTGERIFQGRLTNNIAPAASNQPEESGGPGTGRQRTRGFGGASDYASAIIADGKIFYTARNGDIYVLKATDTLQQLAVNRVTNNDEEFSATPAVSDGQLFIRSSRYLYCIAAKQE
ncbi:MAG: PQQ-binding-like beta-propeller repeat protein [Planctomycetaceae bacterium]